MPPTDHEMNLGTQPLDGLMDRLGLGNHDLVAASTAQLTHKQVAKARKGRRLTRNLQNKVLVALNAASKADQPMDALFNYKG